MDQAQLRGQASCKWDLLVAFVGGHGQQAHVVGAWPAQMAVGVNAKEWRAWGDI
jgi:hypothetical protein